MRRELIDVLACPVCKRDLRLTVTEENETEIVAGFLNCARCGHTYPIEDAIPNLLPPETRP